MFVLYIKELFSESEFFDQLAVALEVVLAQVGEQTFSFTHQLHQTAVSGEIFFIGLQVFGYAVDPFCQQSNLALDRTGVSSSAAVSSEETRFFLVCQIRHLKMFVCTGKVIPKQTHPLYTANDGPSVVSADRMIRLNRCNFCRRQN